MRARLFALLLALVPATAHAQRPPAEDIARARALDQQGAKAYGEGRYNDAIRYFNEAYRLGGPPFEIWNVAKCHLKLDQPEDAANTLEKYLALPNLPPDDRAEAQKQLDELKKRPSTLTIASSPTGAVVAVDGKPLESKTPTSTTVEPGAHMVTVTLSDHATFTRQVDARYGRAIILDAPLTKDGSKPSGGTAETKGKPEPGKPETPATPSAPYVPDPARRIALRGDIGIELPKYGGVGGDAQPGFLVSGTYRVSEGQAPALSVGLLLFLAGDTWKNTVNAPNAVNGCQGGLKDPLSATAFAAYAIGDAGFDLIPRLRVHGVGGVGVAVFAAGDLGGDVFIPSCTTSPGARIAFLLGTQVDYAVTDTFRFTAMPITFQLQPAFAGVRTDPVDASGLWYRAMIALGVGVDL